jgi:hypothetical protein
MAWVEQTLSGGMSRLKFQALLISVTEQLSLTTGLLSSAACMYMVMMLSNHMHGVRAGNY